MEKVFGLAPSLQELCQTDPIQSSKTERQWRRQKESLDAFEIIVDDRRALTYLLKKDMLWHTLRSARRSAKNTWLIEKKFLEGKVTPK